MKEFKDYMIYSLLAFSIIILLVIVIGQTIQINKQQEQIEKLKIDMEVIYIDFYK